MCGDSQVHGISTRLGYVRTRTPEETEMALRATLPKRYWIGYNDLLVAFGQNVCAPISPRCSTCPVRALCRRAAVKSSPHARACLAPPVGSEEAEVTSTA